MKAQTLQASAATAARWICGGTLIYASLDKIGNAQAFAKVIQNYHVLPDTLIPLAAVVLSWLECIAGSALVLGLAWRGAVVIFCALMAAYTLSLSWNLIQGVDMTCGCFSVDSTEPVTWKTVGRDGIFLFLGLFAWLSPRTYAELSALIAAFSPGKKNNSRENGSFRA